MIFKKFLPASLLGRSIIIIFVPIFLLVIITSVIFYQTSWNIISKRLTESVVADINVIVKLIKQDLETEAIEIAAKDFKMKINIQKNYIDLSFVKVSEKISKVLINMVQDKIIKMKSSNVIQIKNAEKEDIFYTINLFYKKLGL